MTINYNTVDDKIKLQSADLILKREAIDSALADIQTARAEAEVGYTVKEQALQAEKGRITEEIRKLQKATLV